MAQQIHPKHWKRNKTPPVRRVWIPKPGKDERRPLGIPTMSERARQCLAKLALEPEWEARFEGNSYGFRPGRSCHDAIGAIFNGIRFKSKFVLDADLKACFDNINQQAHLGKTAHVHRSETRHQGMAQSGRAGKWGLHSHRSGNPARWDN
jgi:RNA-directed DNA polymerase